MTFDMDAFIEKAKSTFGTHSQNETAEQDPGALTIKLKSVLSLKKGTEYKITDLLTGLPSDLSNLQIKMFGNCTYFPFKESKTVLVSDRAQDITFRMGANGVTQQVVIPAGSH